MRSLQNKVADDWPALQCQATVVGVWPYGPNHVRRIDVLDLTQCSDLVLAYQPFQYEILPHLGANHALEGKRP